MSRLRRLVRRRTSPPLRLRPTPPPRPGRAEPVMDALDDSSPREVIDVNSAALQPVARRRT